MPSVEEIAERRFTRPERVRQINDLLAEGMSSRDVARRLGLAYSTVRSLLCDPDGSREKQRRLGYQGTCESCGGRTFGGNGRAKAPKLCSSCSRDRQIAAKKWTRQAVIEAIQTWASEHGAPPKATDWNSSLRERRFPSANTVYNYPGSPFRSWADAIEAAGFARPVRGCYERTDEVRRRMSESQRRREHSLGDTQRRIMGLLADGKRRTASEIANGLGLGRSNTTNALYALRRRGILTTDGVRPSPGKGKDPYLWTLDVRSLS